MKITALKAGRLTALLLAAGCAAPQVGPPPGGATVAPAAAENVAAASVQPASVAPAAVPAPAKAAVPLTKETAARILENLGVVVLPKGPDGMHIKHLVNADGQPAKSRTAVDMRWDGQGLTIVFDCEDKEVKTSQRERDDAEIWKDDTVEVFLDVARRRHTKDDRWVHVIVNAAGVAYDERGPLKYGKWTAIPLNANIGWNLDGLKTKAEKTKQGWRAEISIPWEALGGAPAAGEVWGFNLARANWPDEEYQCLFPTYGSFYDSDRWGVLAFVEKPVHEDLGVLSSILSELRIKIVPKGETGVTFERFGLIDGRAAPVDSSKTAATTRWNDQGLTVIMDCEDRELVAAETPRDDMDNLWTSNETVEVFLDIGNHRDPRSDQWFHLMVGAAGSVADERGPMEWNPGIKSDRFGKYPPVPRGGDRSWNLPGLKTKAEKTKTGWRAEIFMPWEGLGVKAPAAGDIWGFNLARNNRHPKQDTPEIHCLAPTVSYFLTLTRWGYLMFVDQPLDLPPPPAAAALAVPPPGKDAPKPGKNLVFNGDFSKLSEGWTGLFGEFEGTNLLVDYKGSWIGLKGLVLHRESAKGNISCHVGAGYSLASQPFPLDPGCRYRLKMEMWPFGTPNAKVCVLGYRWKPGVKPHGGTPKIEELQQVYRSPPLVYRDILPWTVWEQDLAYPGGAPGGGLDFPALDAPLYDQRVWRQVAFGVVRVDAQYDTRGYTSGDSQANVRVDNVSVARVE